MDGPLIQDGHHAGIRLGSNGPAKALLQLDLHLRHHHGPQEGMEIRISLPLFFLQRVGHGEWQPGDDQQGHAVSRKVKALPGRPGGQQDAPRRALKLPGGMHRIAPQSEQGIEHPLIPQALFHRRHGGIGGEQHQGMAVGRVQQGGDLLRQFFIVPPAVLAGREAWEVQQIVLAVCKGRGGDRLPHTAVCQQAGVLFEPPEIPAHRHGAGGQDHGRPLPPKRLPELLRQIRDSGAEHRAAPVIFRRVADHIWLAPQE